MNCSRFSRLIYLKVFLAIIWVVLPAVWLAAPSTVLIVQDHQTGEVLFKKGMNIDESFTLEYVHSITKQPVQEIFYVKDKDTLALKEMYYDSFGSNLPVGPEKLAGETTTFIVEDNYYKITYENRVFDRVPLRVGQVVADHQLIFQDGKRLRFADVTKGGSYIIFYVRPFFDLF
ncbi:MAG: DUF1850 domain-containing protein [Desulfotomaculum sp.]|nr:DUF1850 domain-containing protein [Desulfotomaculum sp.]